eukprot:SAG22_NODE_115_length_19315_cov_10.458368_15_plen_45_part_01
MKAKCRVLKLHQPLRRTRTDETVQICIFKIYPAARGAAAAAAAPR